MEWLENVNVKLVWDANHFISMPGSDGGCTKIPALKEKVNGRVIREVQDNAEKSRLLHTTFSRTHQRMRRMTEHISILHRHSSLNLYGTCRSTGPSGSYNHTRPQV